MFDGKVFGEEMVAIVRSYVDRQVQPLLAQIRDLSAQVEALSAREPVKGDSVTVDDVAPLLADLVDKAVSAIPPAIAPAAIEPDYDAITGHVEVLVAEAVGALPPPEPGKSVDAAEVEAMVAHHVGAAVAALPAPTVSLDSSEFDDLVSRAAGQVASSIVVPTAPDPIELDYDRILREVRSIVDAAVEGLPVPKDGKNLTADDARPLIEDLVSRAVAALPVAKDGIGMAGMLIDRDGKLKATMTDGTLHDLGTVVGRDADMEALKSHLGDLVAAIPVPENGKNGFELDDFDIERIDERTLKFKFERGNELHTFELEFPVMIYRGVYQDGKDYTRGDVVTWAGSLWHCERAATSKPDSGEDWKLIVKRGRDGKNLTDK